jgi:hypothetical protein
VTGDATVAALVAAGGLAYADDQFDDARVAWEAAIRSGEGRR